jgi:type I restriction enzyme S subunit
MMGSFIRLPAKELSRRIDAGYYRPEYVANAKRLLDSSLERAELSSLVSDGRRTLYFGTSTLEEEEAPEGWVPFLTSDDIGEDGFFVETRARRRVPPSFLDQYPAGRLRSGELLVKVKGPNQTTAYIETIPQFPLLVSGTIWGGLVRKDIVDPHYLVAALSCPYAVMARTRLRTNLNVEFLGAEDLLSLALPKPTHPVQRYIGDKVRQAERLRERARKLERESSSFFELAEWTQPRAGHRRSYVAGRQAISSERLDAPFYDPGHDALAAVLQGQQAVHLSQIATLVEDRWNRLGQQFDYFEIGDLDIASGVIAASRLPVGSAPSRAQILVEPWDVLVSTVRPNRKNVGLVPASDEPLPLVASTGFSTLRFGTPERAVFYHSFLRSDAATQQLMRWNSGATYPAIESDVPLRLLAPDFGDDVIREKGSRWLQKFLALDASRRLTTASMLLIEQLIEGGITEADLIAAQNALEIGDRSGDRAVLRTLRQNGAADGRPLIPDLDGLYALLDEPDAEQDG